MLSVGDVKKSFEFETVPPTVEFSNSIEFERRKLKGGRGFISWDNGFVTAVSPLPCMSLQKIIEFYSLVSCCLPQGWVGCPGVERLPDGRIAILGEAN